MNNCQEAVEHVMRKFPFPGHIEPNPKFNYRITIAQTVLRHLQPGKKILDFGAGACINSAILQFLGFKCSAYDDYQDDWVYDDDKMEKTIKFAEEMGIDLRLSGHDKVPFQERESFDMVMLIDVLEHLWSPREVLNDLIELLKPRGFLLVAVPNAANIRKRLSVLSGKTNYAPFNYYYWYPGPWRGHIREYVKGDLVLLAGYLNLEVAELRCHHRAYGGLPRYLRPVYAGLTYLFPAWRESWYLVAQKPSDWKPKRSLSKQEFDQVVTASTPWYLAKK